VFRAAGALFAPLRARVQRRVDLRFNRARYDAERIVDPDAVRADLLDTVHRSLEPTHAGIWIGQIR
jgi:hypothetical protein